MLVFENIGGKIKTVALWFATIGISISIIAGFFMIIIALINYADVLCILGIVTLSCGSLLSWITSLFIYGYGQLIENTDKLVESQDKNSKTRTNTGKLADTLYSSES